MQHLLRYRVCKELCRLSRQATFLATLGAAILSVSTGNALAQDTVYRVPEANARGPEALTGKVIDFTGRGLSLRLPDGRTQTIRPERVERVDTASCAEQAAGDELFTAGGCLERLQRPAQAATLYREVVAGAGSLSEADEAQRRLQTLAGAAAAH